MTNPEITPAERGLLAEARDIARRSHVHAFMDVVAVELVVHVTSGGYSLIIKSSGIGCFLSAPGG